MTNVEEIMKFLSTLDKNTPVALGIEHKDSMILKTIQAAKATAVNERTKDRVDIVIFLADNTNFEYN